MINLVYKLPIVENGVTLHSFKNRTFFLLHSTPVRNKTKWREAEVVCYDVVEHRQSSFHCKLRSIFLFKKRKHIDSRK